MQRRVRRPSGHSANQLRLDRAYVISRSIAFSSIANANVRPRPRAHISSLERGMAATYASYLAITVIDI